MTPEQHAYLAEHRWALLSTIRRDGSPQVSMVAYHFDGTDIVVSCRASSAKARNARRDPRAVITVAEDRRYLAVAGPVEVVVGGERLHALTARLQASLESSDSQTLQRDVDAGLEAVGRVILRIDPSGAVGRT